ncbi:MAG: tRNA 2-thiouridine(34) synthase MnmA [Candidatus Yanofskybacteria bacterium]|nr:tRNA 2-thiouridine(34) synthase MnmA [Candidatus Yanofskybacteria bacterium]
MKQNGKTVFVGLSGGVDSSVAAALLRKEGYKVIGVYMKCWTEGASCTSQEDERSARLAAAHLGIPLYVWNFLVEYRAKVVDYMLEGYRRGLTPNPDIMCNKEIKFGLFFERAMALGADYVATGHYARITRHGTAPRILQGVDKEKDQSYFLSFIRPEVLPKVLFPIGEYKKTEVRKMAKKFGLPNAERKDSQGICFVGKIEIGDFLRQYIKPKKGSIVDTAGKKLGEHDGAFYYTIGQRKGIGLSGGPWYVVEKDLLNNTLTVSKQEKDILHAKAHVTNVHWLLPQAPQDLDMEVRLRYRQQSIPVSLTETGKDSYTLSFQTAQRAITPGQFAVFYKGEEMVGAGVLTH